MAQVIETVAESKHREGKAFLFLYSELSLAAVSSDDFVICVGSTPIAVSEISIKGDGELMNWQAFGGTQITDGTGDKLNDIHRNPVADTDSGIEVVINPTITSDGQPFFDQPIDLIAQVGAGNRAYLDETLVSSLFTLQANACYLVRINNADASAVKFSLNINIYTE